MKHLLITITLLSISFLAKSEEIINPDSLWDNANTAYINGDYQGAIQLYDQIAGQGLFSSDFYFNLGNAHYKNNDIAHAILYYQKALLIAPNDSDILYNLKVAQSQTRDQIEMIPELFLHRWARAVGHTFNCTGWSILSLVALAVLLSSILVFLLSKHITLRKTGFGVGIFSVVILWVSTLYALDERREILEHNQAVVMSKSISIKSSPDHSATELFMLHDGTTVKIIRQIDKWFEISISDGKTGWIEQDRVKRI